MNVLAYIVSLVLFLFGMFLLGEAFAVETGQPWVFFGGIVSISVAVAIPVQVLKRTAP